MYRILIARDELGKEIDHRIVPTSQVLDKVKGWWHNYQGQVTVVIGPVCDKEGKPE